MLCVCESRDCGLWSYRLRPDLRVQLLLVENLQVLWILNPMLGCACSNEGIAFGFRHGQTPGSR